MSDVNEVKADLLGNFLRIIDCLDQRDLPAYAEVCQCGAEMTIAKDVPASERKRMVANFLGRHNHRRVGLCEATNCGRPVVTGFTFCDDHAPTAAASVGTGEQP